MMVMQPHDLHGRYRVAFYLIHGGLRVFSIAIVFKQGTN